MTHEVRARFSIAVEVRVNGGVRVTASRSLLRSAALVATLGIAPAANAQLTASVEAFAGYYRPFGHFAPAPTYSSQLPSQPSDLKGPAWGGTAHLTLGRRFGVAGEVAATRSEVPEVITPGGPRGPTDASVVLGLLLAQYDLSAKPGAYHLWVNAGPAAIHHGGDAYSPYGSPTSLGGAVGMTLVVPIRGHLELSADATGLFYTLDVPMHHELGLTPGSVEHGDQRDALVRLGLMWTKL